MCLCAALCLRASAGSVAITLSGERGVRPGRVDSGAADLRGHIGEIESTIHAHARVHHEELLSRVGSVKELSRTRRRKNCDDDKEDPTLAPATLSATSAADLRRMLNAQPLNAGRV